MHDLFLKQARFSIYNTQPTMQKLIIHLKALNSQDKIYSHNPCQKIQNVTGAAIL